MKDTVVYVRTQREMYTNVYNTDVRSHAPQWRSGRATTNRNMGLKTWKKWTDWPLMVLSVVFLVVYSWEILSLHAYRAV